MADQFEKWTQPARKVLSYSREEAQHSHQSRIGTTHLLLALLRDKPTAATLTLDKLGVSQEQIIQAAGRFGAPGQELTNPGAITDKVKRTIELAVVEAREMRLPSVGTGHILLGLLREERGIAATILADLGVNLFDARQVVEPYAREEATFEQLRLIRQRYDLSRWNFTQRIAVEHHAIPHSHPILTLSTRHLDDDGLLLATYLHEQLHWFVDERREGTARAVSAFRTRYSHPPVGHPDGSDDAESSYLHYAVCYLEWRALLDVVGQEETTRIFAFWRQDHYRAIYATVMDDQAAIEEIVTREIGLP